LVRNKAYKEGENPEDQNPDSPCNGFAIHELKVTQAETITKVHGKINAIGDDQMNPAMIWIELEDDKSIVRKGYRRTIGMMAHARDRELFRVGESRTFVVEVHAAHPQYIGDPEIRKTVVKPMKLHLRFVAIEDKSVGEDPPLALDDCDDPHDDDDGEIESSTQ
jgi:hypothetical protein